MLFLIEFVIYLIELLLLKRCLKSVRLLRMVGTPPHIKETAYLTAIKVSELCLFMSNAK